MRKDRNLATDMRKNGHSYREIRTALRIPLGTLSEWFSGETWSDDIKNKLTAAAQEISTVRMRELDRIRGIHLKNVYQEAEREAEAEFMQLKYNPLFIAGTMVYWGEGDKVSKNQVRLSNVDPLMIRLFVDFIEKICRVPRERIRLSVLIYPDLAAQDCIRYWSEASGLPQGHFSKCTVILGRHKTRRLSQGVCIVYVSSTYLKVKVLRWLKLLPKELMSRAYYANI